MNYGVGDRVWTFDSDGVCRVEITAIDTEHPDIYYPRRLDDAWRSGSAGCHLFLSEEEDECSRHKELLRKAQEHLKKWQETYHPGEA